MLILPIKHSEANDRFILIRFEGSNLEEAGQKHDKRHLVARPVIDSGRVPEPVVQVDANLVDGRMVNGLKNFLQLSPTFLQK